MGTDDDQVVYQPPQYQPFILADAELVKPPGNQRWWLYDEMFKSVEVQVKSGKKTITETRLKPYYSVQEVSKFFFGRSPHWLRWRYLSDQRVSKVTGQITKAAKHPDGFFILDGEPLVPKTSLSGYRWYTLADVERMAAALGQTGIIDGLEVSAITSLVRASAVIWKVSHVTNGGK